MDKKTKPDAFTARVKQIETKVEKIESQRGYDHDYAYYLPELSDLEDEHNKLKAKALAKTASTSERIPMPIDKKHKLSPYHDDKDLPDDDTLTGTRINTHA